MHQNYVQSLLILLFAIVASSASPGLLGFKLPERDGVKPNTTHTMPHVQIDQNAPDSLYHVLAYWVYTELSAVEEKPSLISVKGARALSVKEDVHIKNKEALMKGREFGHMHPLPDASWHLTLSLADAEEVVKKGWGEYHPLVEIGIESPNLVMVFGPRNTEEMEVIQKIIKRSYYFATGLIK
jgi:hypothetical protein